MLLTRLSVAPRVMAGAASPRCGWLFMAQVVKERGSEAWPAVCCWYIKLTIGKYFCQYRWLIYFL